MRQFPSRPPVHWAAIVGLLAVIVPLSSNGVPIGEAAGKSSPRVAFLLTNATGPRWIRDYNFLKGDLHRLSPGTPLDVQLANGDPVRQLGQADQELSKGAKVLIVVPADAHEASGIVSKAHRAGAKVIAYDELILSSQLDAYDAFDRVAVGRAEGQWLTRHVPRGGTILLINGPKGSANAQLYRRGYYQGALMDRFRTHYFRSGGDFWIQGWDASRAMKQTSRALARDRYRVQGVLAASDDLANGAVTALEVAGSAGNAQLTGQGATAAALSRILTGEQGMTVYRPVSAEAWAAATAAAALLHGKALPSAFKSRVRVGRGHVQAALLQPVVITRRNVKTALTDGVVTKKQVCTGIPKKACTL